jgi:cytochrome c-type biogenesis protein CcmE
MQNSTLTKILLTVGVAVGGAGFLVYSSVGHAQHYEMVDELLAGGTAGLERFTGKELKIHGWVEAGSIVEKPVNQEMYRTFVLQRSGKKMRVFNTGPKPDTFKDLSEVVATGRLVPVTEVAAIATALDVKLDSQATYMFQATDLMAKCPSKYEGAQTNKQLGQPAKPPTYQ